jgi:hypothetical protein
MKLKLPYQNQTRENHEAKLIIIKDWKTIKIIRIKSNLKNK